MNDARKPLMAGRYGENFLSAYDCYLESPLFCYSAVKASLRQSRVAQCRSLGTRVLLYTVEDAIPRKGKD